MRLPHWRLGDQLHHAAQPVHGYHVSVHEKHRAEGRNGHVDLDYAALYHCFYHCLDSFAAGVGVAGDSTWP